MYVTVHMIFLSQQNVNQNGVKNQLKEILFVNEVNSQKISELKNHRKFREKLKRTDEKRRRTNSNAQNN